MKLNWLLNSLVWVHSGSPMLVCSVYHVWWTKFKADIFWNRTNFHHCLIYFQCVKMELLVQLKIQVCFVSNLSVVCSLCLRLFPMESLQFQEYTAHLNSENISILIWILSSTYNLYVALTVLHHTSKKGRRNLVTLLLLNQKHLHELFTAITNTGNFKFVVILLKRAYVHLDSKRLKLMQFISVYQCIGRQAMDVFHIPPLFQTSAGNLNQKFFINSIGALDIGHSYSSGRLQWLGISDQLMLFLPENYIGVGSNSILGGPNVTYTTIAVICAACMNINKVSRVKYWAPMNYLQCQKWSCMTHLVVCLGNTTCQTTLALWCTQNNQHWNGWHLKLSIKQLTLLACKLTTNMILE